MKAITTLVLNMRSSRFIVRNISLTSSRDFSTRYNFTINKSNQPTNCYPMIFYGYFCRLAEVGKLENPKIQGKYDTGQLLLHRIFGYRGVVLFPWSARVFDRDVAANKKDSKYLRKRTKFMYTITIYFNFCGQIC